MSRITPSQVIEAYQETGLDVVRGCVYDPVFHRSCALGALYCSTAGANYRNSTLTRWVEIIARALGIDESYAQSFAMGWDGNLPDQDTDIEAYEDGAEAYDAVTLWRESQDDIRYGEVATVDDGGNIVVKGEPIPALAVHVNDHGNTTLYRVKIELEEVWSVV